MPACLQKREDKNKIRRASYYKPGCAGSVTSPLPLLCLDSGIHLTLYAFKARPYVTARPDHISTSMLCTDGKFRIFTGVSCYPL